jgi:hypothetical protein
MTVASNAHAVATHLARQNHLMPFDFSISRKKCPEEVKRGMLPLRS